MRFLLTLFAMLFAAPTLAADAPRANLTVLTDGNLVLPLTQLAHDFGRHTHTPLTIVARDEAHTETQIEQGIEAHLLITADKSLLARLSEQGLTDVSSRRFVARTRLALVTTPTMKKKHRFAERISFAAMLAATGSTPIYANAPTSLDGAAAAALAADEDLVPLLAARLNHEPNVSELTATLEDEDALGLMFAPDALMEPGLVILSLLPEDVAPSANVEAVVLGGESMSNAKEFVIYLSSPRAQAILSTFGFQPARAL